MQDKSRRERKKEATERNIIDVAMTLFRTQGFTNTTMELIAAQADVAKATLYKYFPIKEAIIAAYWRQNVQQKKDVLPQLFASFSDTPQRLTAVFLSAASIFQREPEFARIQFTYQFQMIGQHPESQNSRSGFEGFLTHVLTAGQTLGDVRADISATTMASQLLLLFTSTCLVWFSTTDTAPLEDQLSQTITLFIQGARYDQH